MVRLNLTPMASKYFLLALFYFSVMNFPITGGEPMRLFIDTANIEEIKKSCGVRGLSRGLQLTLINSQRRTCFSRSNPRNK